MDIITEINRLPNYLYAIDIPPYWIILGGEGCKKAEQYDRIEFERLIKKHDNYLKIFNQETMSDEDKKTVALLSKKIRSMCDVRLIQYYTRNQQDEFIKQLPQSEKEKIEKQITLYKQAREFYRDYVNFFTVFLFLYFIFYIFYYIIKCKNFCDVCDFCDVLFSSSAGLQAEPLHSKSLRLGLSGRRFFASYLSL